MGFDSRGPFRSPVTNTTPDPSIWRRIALTGPDPGDWGPDHTDWRNPTIVDVHTDGRIIVAARYISNNYGGTGSRMYVSFTIELWFLKDSDNRVGRRYDLGLGLIAPPGVGKHHDASDVAKEYRFADVTQTMGQSDHFYIYQHHSLVQEPIGGSGDGGGGVDVSFPPITFP